MSRSFEEDREHRRGPCGNSRIHRSRAVRGCPTPCGPAVGPRSAGGDRHSDGQTATTAGRAGGVAGDRNGDVPKVADSRLGWPFESRTARPQRTVVSSAVAEARERLGADPLEHLFEMCAKRWAHASARRHEWRGLAIYGVDVSTLRVADSTQNRAHSRAPRDATEIAATRSSDWQG